MSKKLKGKGKRSVADTNGVIITDVKRSKVTCEFKISEYLLQPELQNSLKEAWLSNENHDFEINKSITLIKDPFNCLIVKNVIILFLYTHLDGVCLPDNDLPARLLLLLLRC